jgi:hypothetical protein
MIKAESTQKFLNIAEIKEDVVVLKNGTVRAVLLVSSINFALKGEDEQNAIISAYVGFLNSLSFPLQIVVQSRTLNIDGYLGKLAELEKAQTNELLRLQIADYQAFLKELLDLGQIMTKKFFVMVPYGGLDMGKKKFWEMTADALSPTRELKLGRQKFEKFKQELFKRVDFVASGLSSIGLQSQVLDTQNLITLYYNTYNPEIAEFQKLGDVDKIRLD